jgi:hypothetical protein
MTRASGIVLQVLVLAIFASAMFFFTMAIGRTEPAPSWDSLRPVGGAYLLTFVIKSDTGAINYVTVPGIATEAECNRFATEMLTRPDRSYACHLYQMAH